MPIQKIAVSLQRQNKTTNQTAIGYGTTPIKTMGQRTLTLTTYIDENGNKTNKAYYNQWGIGRIQLNAILGNFLCDFGQPMFDLSASEHGRRDMIDVSKEINVSNLQDFTDIEKVKRLFGNIDNNNGGIVFIADDQNKSSKIGFLLGGEECSVIDEQTKTVKLTEQPYSRFVPFDEWAEKVGGKYVNESYRKMFQAFCEHFNVEVL